ncbi:MAG: glycosyl hydrolase family 18 protein [bacterium]|nr:glycosyl hydrolase family 18 protein [bacterium]
MKKLKFIIFRKAVFILMTTVFAVTTITDDSIAKDMWVIAYHPCYQWNDVPAQNVPWEHITHLSLGYLWPVKTGGVYTVAVLDGWSGDWNSWRNTAKSYVDTGHIENRKVLCMLGGAGSNPDSVWNKATSTANIDSFVANIKAILQPMGFDGLDLDWEDAVDYSKLVILAQKLRAAWPDAIITIPTGCQGQDAVDLAPAKNAVDVFMPMTYLDIAQWGGWLIPIPLTPLYSAGSNPYSIEYVLNRWTSAGVPDSMIMMGVGGFGSVWGDLSGNGRAPIAPYSNTDLNEGVEGETYSIANDNLVTWSWVKQVLTANPEMVEAWDDTGKCSYWHTPAVNDLVSVQIWGQPRNISLIFYETPRSIAEKKTYCLNNNMKGMMFWTLSQMMDGDSCPILETVIPVEETQFPKVSQFKLCQNYPNPVTAGTYVEYALPKNAMVKIEIYDRTGRIIKTLIANNQKSGNYRVFWNGQDNAGQKVSNGIYFCRMEADNFKATKNIVLLKNR